MKRKTILIVTLSVVAFTFTGCGMVQGFSRDLNAWSQGQTVPGGESVRAKYRRDGSFDPDGGPAYITGSNGVPAR